MEISFQGFEKDYNGNFFPRFLKIQWKLLSKVLKKMDKQGPIGRANLFNVVFGKQITTSFYYNEKD